MLRSVASFLVAALLAFGLTACDSSPQATSPESTQTERSAQKYSSVSIDGPRQVAPGQTCRWTAVYTDAPASFEWYQGSQQKIGEGVFYTGSFQGDTELNVKVYDSYGVLVTSASINLNVCSDCEASETECNNLPGGPSPL